MGKIFDALEKSQKEQPGQSHEFAIQSRHKTVSEKFAEKKILSHNGLDKNLITFFKPQSMEAEQFKILRTKLLFPASGEPPRSIMITSALPGEGKSFVTSNLAVSIAQNIQEHVLLIDCDIRRPNIHQQFGFNGVPGLSEYLSNNTPLCSLLLKTEIDKLTILAGGKPPHNPSELLSSRLMSKLLEEVKARYKDRYILIDSPPPKLTAETNAIARQVDAILIVIKYGSTPREMVADMVEILGKEKIIGIVFNHMEVGFSNYYGYGKYGKHNKRCRKYYQ